MNKKYWIDRVSQYGHTGWSDQVTYLYDQNMRLQLIKQIVKKYFPNGARSSLDYGCGSGDFTNLLSIFSKQTIGVDLADEIIMNATNKYNQKNVSFYCTDKFELKSNKYSIITAITVFQHILDDEKLIELLHTMNTTIEDDGVLIIIDSYGKQIENDYLKQREFESFLHLLEKTNFRLLESYNLYHPQYSPTKLFKKYRNSFLIKVFNKLKLMSWIKKISNLLVSYDSPLIIEESTTKLLVVKKQAKK